MIKYRYPVFIILSILGLILSACVYPDPTPSKSGVIKGNLNNYEVVTVGDYTCVGMDGYKSGGLWCERTKK